MMDPITKDFYENYLTFNNYLEFRMFDLRTKFNGRNPMSSMYANCIEDVERIIELRDSDDWIVYVSANPRNIKGKVDGSVKYRRTFFFDIECDGQKPPLTDEVYYNKLMETALYIWKELKKIGIDPNMLMESGRGAHLGIAVVPMLSETYEERFKYWIKNLIKTLMKNRPHEDIKFDDAMQNLSRIESAPGFCHNKYPEKPRRKVLKLFLHENNIYPFINRQRSLEIKKRRYFPNYRKKYNDRTFYQSPEWLLIANNPDLPEGEIHNKILLTIKIMARDHELDTNKLQLELMKIGYEEVVDTPSDDYIYSPWTIFNWAMNNAKYCLRNKVVLTLPFEDDNKYPVKEMTERCHVTPPEYILRNFADVMSYIRGFNKMTSYSDGQKTVIFFNLMWKNIKKKLIDEDLYNYIEFLKLKDFISCEISKDIDIKETGRV